MSPQVNPDIGLHSPPLLHVSAGCLQGVSPHTSNTLLFVQVKFLWKKSHLHGSTRKNDKRKTAWVCWSQTTPHGAIMYGIWLWAFCQSVCLSIPLYLDSFGNFHPSNFLNFFILLRVVKHWSRSHLAYSDDRICQSIQWKMQSDNWEGRLRVKN